MKTTTTIESMLNKNETFITILFIGGIFFTGYGLFFDDIKSLIIGCTGLLMMNDILVENQVLKLRQYLEKPKK